MDQPSLTRRDDSPRRHRALKRTAKFRPSLRDEEGAHFAHLFWKIKALKRRSKL
jgi:hypothetical protein